jgi:hypothetical protein
MSITAEMDKDKVKCFVDERNLLLREMWHNQLLPSMTSSRYFVAFVSQAYLDKVNQGDTNYCYKEYKDAKTRGAIMILILFDGVRLTGGGEVKEDDFAHRLRCPSATGECIPLVVEFLSRIINNNPNPRPIQNQNPHHLNCLLHTFPNCSLDNGKGKVHCRCVGKAPNQYVMAVVSDVLFLS